MDCFEIIRLFILSLDYSLGLGLVGCSSTGFVHLGIGREPYCFTLLMCILNRSTIQLFVDSSLAFSVKEMLTFYSLRGWGGW